MLIPELDLGAMEDCLVREVQFFFTSHSRPGIFVPLTWGSDGTRMCCREKTSQCMECDDLEKVLLGSSVSSHLRGS